MTADLKSVMARVVFLDVHPFAPSPFLEKRAARKILAALPNIYANTTVTLLEQTSNISLVVYVYLHGCRHLRQAWHGHN
jgi:23S rRNA G2445 N2-methylase RlmL